MVARKQFRTTVKIPETGKTVSLRRAREQMVRRHAWLNMPTADMRKTLGGQIEDFQRLANAVEEFNRTKSYGAAARAGGVSRHTAKFWVKGMRLPRSVSFKRSAYYKEMRKPLRIKPSRFPEFAYVLGAMLTKASAIRYVIDKKEGRIDFGVADSRLASAFRQKLEQSTGIKAKVVKRKMRTTTMYIVNIGSRNLLQLFNEITKYGARPPARFLDSKKARQQFAQAVYDSKGNVNVGGTAKTKRICLQPTNPEIDKLLSIILLENGLHPTTWGDGTIALPSAETQKFLQTIGFSKKVKPI